LDRSTKTDILHLMRNIAQKFKFIESLQQTQHRMIETVNKDWDKVWELLDERETDKR